MILFLNKKDLFEQKIAKASISKHFSDYDGAPQNQPRPSFRR
jgi:hypothetical protein